MPTMRALLAGSIALIGYLIQAAAQTIPEQEAVFEKLACSCDILDRLGYLNGADNAAGPSQSGKD